MTLRTIAYTGTAPKPREVKLSEKPMIIQYKGNTYEIRYNELRNLGFQHKEAVVEVSYQLGLDAMPYFSNNCLSCDHFSNSIEKLLVKGKEVGDAECSYKQDNNLKIAAVFANPKNGREFRAIKNCAFLDALVEVLGSVGVLDAYVKPMQFNFRPISDFEDNLADPKEFEVKKPDLIHRIIENVFS